MTRFEMERSGALGAYWKVNAEKELAQIKKQLDEGKITIDDSGVARNCIGRVLMSDLLEKLTYITDKVDVEATEAARTAEVSKSLETYRKKAATTQELNEMRAAFGKGQAVVDIFSGQRFSL